MNKVNNKQMNAVVCPKYGTPKDLRIEQIKKPNPANQEVLVKIHASSVTAADSMIRQGKPYYGRLFLGLLKPKNPVLGTGFAGIVEAVGENVTQFKEGDSVFGEVVFGSGTYTEYISVSEDSLIAPIPEKTSYKEAAPICDGALTSINFLQTLANIQKGQKVLINGASGSLGTAAVQLAKYFGAEVTGVCSTANLALIKSLGADKVIDYTKKDFTAQYNQYDIIYDTVGKSSFSKCKKALTENGIYISPVLSLSLLLQMIFTSNRKGKKAKFSATGILPIPELKVLLNTVIDAFQTGQIKSVIDRSYPMEHITEAHTYIDSGRKRGNVVISL